MASESQYQQAIIELKDGLQLVEPVINTNRGSLSDCLNFEVSDRLGYSRCGGDEKFDQGDYNSSLIYTNSIMIPGSSFISFTAGEAIVTEDPLYKGEGKTIGYFIGTTVTTSGDSLLLWGVIVVTDYEVFLSLVDGISVIKGATSGETALFSNARSYTTYLGAAADTEGLNDLFYANNRLRSAPNDSIGRNNPITGLHWYKDNCYAITDFLIYDFTDATEEVFPGDIITGTAPTTAARVVATSLASGLWDGGGSGTILLQPITGSPTGVQTASRWDGTVYTNTTALTLTGPSDESPWAAGLWRSKEAGGWEEVALGYTIAFSGGTDNGPPPVFKRGQGNATVVPVSTNSPPSTATDYVLGTWTKTGAATIVDCVNTDDTKYVSSAASSAANPATYIQVKDFISTTGIPADSEITGMTVTISAIAPTTDSAKYPYLVMQPFDNTGQIGAVRSTPTLNVTTPNTAFTASDSYTVGGALDTWGITDLRAALTNGFGFNIAPRAGKQGGSTVTWRINYVTLAVHYSSNIDTYYFWNGVDDVTAPITSYYVASGDWVALPGEQATGSLQVASITPVGSSTRTYISAGDEIRNAPGGGGGLIAVAQSAGAYSHLPSLAELQENDSRYQLITANFYGNEEWETIYGVSGAGQAFAYDGYYFRTIYTGIAPALDKPRHIAYHQGALALGYRAGNVTLSVQGEPENFDGIQGATSIDVGDPVTGLAGMSGTSLGVFCRGSVNTLIGTNINNYSYSTVSAAEGAIEYTVINAGGEPIYCSNKGISTLSQTAAYGNFLGHRLSEGITPWLLPRIHNTINPLPENYIASAQPATAFPSATGIAFATTCRSKGQYRLVFKDGTMLSMTLQGADKVPSFTIQQADIWTTPADKGDAVKYSKFIPLACSSVIDNSGKERIHISHYNPVADAEAGANTYYVYEREISWSYCGLPIPYRMRLNENFLGSPFRDNTVSKVAIHGLSLGYAPLKVSVGREYGNPLTTDRASPDVFIPRERDGLSQSQSPGMNIVTAMQAGEARSFNFNLFYPLTGDGVVCPPFSVQMLLLQYKEGKGDN